MTRPDGAGRRRGGAGGAGTAGGAGSSAHRAGVGGRPSRARTRPAVSGTNGHAATPMASSSGSRRVSSPWASAAAAEVSGRRHGSVAASRRLTARPSPWTRRRARRSSPAAIAPPTSASAATPQQGRDPVGGPGDGAEQADGGQLLELLPRQLGVGGLRGQRAQRVPQRVDADPVDAVVDAQPVPAAGRHPPPREGEVVVGDHVVGRSQAPPVGVPRPGPQQDRRPPDGMEPDVVLADEVAVPGRRSLPPAPPGVGVAAQGRPLQRRGQVADDRVEPHVQAAVLEAGQRHRHAPVEVAGDRPWAQAGAQPAACLPADERPPAGLVAVQVPLDLRLQQVQAQEELAKPAQPGRRAAAAAARPPQLLGVQRPPAGVALVATGAGGAAGGAVALDVAVGERAALAGAPGGRCGRLRHQPACVQPAEQLLHDRVVPRRGGPAVVVEGDPDPREGGGDALVLAAGQRRR
jgi:hypothetical protein